MALKSDKIQRFYTSVKAMKNKFLFFGHISTVFVNSVAKPAQNS
jgi:hypothetical protein